MKKKAILFTRFPYESAFGGEESHTMTLAKDFKTKGFEPIFLGSCKVLQKAFSDQGFPVRKAWGGKMIVTPWQLLKSFFAFPIISWNLHRQFLKLLVEYDMKACVFLSLNEKLFLTRLAVQKGVQVTWIEHQEIRGWLLSNPWRSQYQRNARFVRVVPISPGNRRALTEKLHINPASIREILNGVEIPTIDLSKRKTEKNLIVTAARLIPKKGMMDFLEALTRLRSLSQPLHILLIGEGEEESSVRAFIREHLISLSIEVLHFLKKENWYRLLEKADIFVLPSRDESETFSLSAAEAMARGCKIVATRCAGIAVHLRDGYDAFIGDPNSPSSLTLQIERALGSSDEIRKNAHQTALRKFNLRRMLREYENLILRL